MMHALYYRVLAALKREEGATAVEYGIMVAGIAVAIILVVFALGDQLNALFQTVVDALPGR
ncbi:MAG: Flp family type IVb pilin [Anaerosomatales bacterium]|nr:Flp family type IVb pilin [Anaerosomatales bacterium]